MPNNIAELDLRTKNTADGVAAARDAIKWYLQGDATHGRTASHFVAMFSIAPPGVPTTQWEKAGGLNLSNLPVSRVIDRALKSLSTHGHIVYVNKQWFLAEAK